MGFPVFKETDFFVMNHTKNSDKKKKKCGKPRYYVRIACSNGKICCAKIMSYTTEKVENNLRLPLSDFCNNSRFNSNSSIDKTLFTMVDSNYINDVKTYCDGLSFTNRESKIIFDFLMESDINKDRFEKFCIDNKCSKLDFKIKMM